MTEKSVRVAYLGDEKIEGGSIGGYRFRVSDGFVRLPLPQAEALHSSNPRLWGEPEESENDAKKRVRALPKPETEHISDEQMEYHAKIAREPVVPGYVVIDREEKPKRLDVRSGAEMPAEIPPPLPVEERSKA